MEKEFGVSREIALLPFVFYLLGLSFGPIMAGPSSESFGRKAVYVFALPCVAAFVSHPQHIWTIPFLETVTDGISWICARLLELVSRRTSLH